MPEEPPRTWTETIEVSGARAVETVKDLLQQGNVRRIVVYRPNGAVLADIPLTASMVGGMALLVFAPTLTTLALLAAFVWRVRIEIVREDRPADEASPPTEDTPRKRRIDIE